MNINSTDSGDAVSLVLICRPPIPVLLISLRRRSFVKGIIVRDVHKIDSVGLSPLPLLSLFPIERFVRRFVAVAPVVFAIRKLAQDNLAIYFQCHCVPNRIAFYEIAAPDDDDDVPQSQRVCTVDWIVRRITVQVVESRRSDRILA